MRCELFCCKEGDDRKQKEKELREALQVLETKYASQQIVPVIGRCGNAQVSPLYRSDRRPIYRGNSDKSDIRIRQVFYVTQISPNKYTI